MLAGPDLGLNTQAMSYVIPYRIGGQGRPGRRDGYHSALCGLVRATPRPKRPIHASAQLFMARSASEVADPRLHFNPAKNRNAIFCLR